MYYRTQVNFGVFERLSSLKNLDPKKRSAVEFVFQECRLLVIAAIQKIAYEEEVPALMGDFAMSKTPELQPSASMRSVNLNNREKPVVFNEFTTAAFRYGHSAQPEDLIAKDSNFNIPRNGQGKLRDNYFDPHLMVQHGPGAMCRGAMTMSGVKPGPGFVDDTLHHFFKVFINY